MYNNPSRMRNIEIPDNLFSNLGESKKSKNTLPENNLLSQQQESEIKLTNYSDKTKYRNRINKMYEDIKDITPIDNEIDNVVYFNNYLEKGIVIKPKISSLKQFWTEYRLIKNEKKSPNRKSIQERKPLEELNNFDDLFEALSLRVAEINNYIDELKEMRASINESSNKLEKEKNELQEEKKEFIAFKQEEENKIEQEKQTLKVNYDRLQTIIDDLDKKLNEIGE